MKVAIITLGLAIAPLFAQERSVITPISTNRVSQVLRILEYLPIDAPCPECGLANHHEKQVAHMSVYDLVTAQVVLGGHTNKVQLRGPSTNYIATNIVMRGQRPAQYKYQQPGWTTPPMPGTNVAPLLPQ